MSDLTYITKSELHRLRHMEPEVHELRAELAKFKGVNIQVDYVRRLEAELADTKKDAESGWQIVGLLKAENDALEAELADLRAQRDDALQRSVDAEHERDHCRRMYDDLRASSVVVREVPRSELQPGDLYADHVSRQEDDNKRTIFVRHVDSVWLIEGVSDEDV